MKVKEESEKAGVKLNTQKTKIMTSGPITSWQIDGETVETVADFIFIWGLLRFHMNCEIFCSSSVKNANGKLVWITLNLYIAFVVY